MTKREWGRGRFQYKEHVVYPAIIPGAERVDAPGVNGGVSLVVQLLGPDMTQKQLPSLVACQHVQQ